MATINGVPFAQVNSTDFCLPMNNSGGGFDNSALYYKRIYPWDEKESLFTDFSYDATGNPSGGFGIKPQTNVPFTTLKYQIYLGDFNNTSTGESIYMGNGDITLVGNTSISINSSGSLGITAGEQISINNGFGQTPLNIRSLIMATSGDAGFGFVVDVPDMGGQYVIPCFNMNR